MTQPPDWAVNVPATQAIHDAPATDAPATNPLTSVCSMLMGGSPFLGSIVNLGTGSSGGVAGALTGGSQTLADILCGFATGAQSSGATADSLISGASDVNDAASANAFATGILGIGQEGGSSGNLALDGMSGGLSFLTSLFSLLGACSCSSTYDPATVTPDAVLSGASDINDAVSGNPMAMGILGIGQEGGASGNAILDAFTGVCSFWGQSCGLLTGNSDVSGATPASVLDTAGGFLSMGNDLLGTSATNGADLADWGGGWSTDFLGLLGDPFGLGSGSASMSIPVDNVAGLFGPPDIGKSMQATVDGIQQGLTNTSDTGVSLATMTNSLSVLAQDVAYLKGGSASAGANPPQVTHYGVAGAHTYDIPAWADYLDVVSLGGGGGGHGCGILWGDGGDGGAWNQVTLERGVDIPGTTTTLSITVGAGGAGSSGSGSNGGASSASGTGWAGITAAGGAGATSASLDYAGKSPGNDTFDDVIYHGGLEQSGYLGAAGNAPGGGGGGGTIIFMSAGAGAPGAVWVLAYETPGS